MSKSKLKKAVRDVVGLDRPPLPIKMDIIEMVHKVAMQEAIESMIAEFEKFEKQEIPRPYVFWNRLTNQVETIE